MTSKGSRVVAFGLVLFAIPWLLFAGIFLPLAIYEAHKGDWIAAAMLFPIALVPGAIGLLLIWKAVSGPRAAQDGPSPWLSRADWRAGRIRFSYRAGALAMDAFALVWSLPALAAGYFLLPQEWAKHAYGVSAIIAIFPLVALFLLGNAAKLTRRWLRYGDSIFLMNPVPVSPGGTLSGEIQLGRPCVVNSEFTLSLESLEHWVSGGGRSGAHEHNEMLWRAEQRVASDGRSIPVSFVLPEDALPTGYSLQSHHVIWRLNAKADADGRKYESHFDVPVFRPGPSAVTSALNAEQLPQGMPRNNPLHS